MRTHPTGASAHRLTNKPIIETMNAILKKLKAAADIPLAANSVAVPELEHLFDKGEPSLFYVASLSAFDKDRMDSTFVAYKKEFDLDDTMEVYRAFVVAYCLCDSGNNRAATTSEVIFDTTNMLAGLGNKIISRLFNVANGANGIYGLREEAEKKSEKPPKQVKKSVGSGGSPSASASRAEAPGSGASAPSSTKNSEPSPDSSL